MTLEYKFCNNKDTAGEGNTCTLKYEGEIDGVDVSMTLKASHRGFMDVIIPVGLREIDIKIVDPNQKIEKFVREDEKLADELIFGLPVDKEVLEGRCTDCARKMWVYPNEVVPLCPKCERDRKREAFRIEQKHDLKEKRLKDSELKAEDEFIFRLEGESPEAYTARKQRIQTEAYEAERRKRAAAQEVTL